MSTEYRLDEVIGALVRYSILDSDAFYCKKENICAGFYLNISDYVQNVLGVYEVRLNGLDDYVEIDLWLKDGFLRLLLGDDLTELRLLFDYEDDNDIFCSGKELVYVVLGLSGEEQEKIVTSNNYTDFMCVFEDRIFEGKSYREQSEEDIKELRRLFRLYYEARTRLTDDSFNDIIAHFKNGGDFNFDMSKFNL